MEPTEPKETAFARALRRAITEQGWSHRAAGTALGVSHTQIGRYLSGESDPALHTATRLAAELRVSLDELAGFAPPRGRSLLLEGVAADLRDAAQAQSALVLVLRDAASRLVPLGEQSDGDGDAETA